MPLFLYLVLILPRSNMKKNTDSNAGVKEIARRAKVSTATVDRVIHNRTGVSEKTKERINKIIQELNYQPNVLAQRLALASREHSGWLSYCLPFQKKRNTGKRHWKA